MNSKLLPVIAALLIFTVAFTPTAYAAQLPVIGPYLRVTTIPEDDQLRATGVMVLSLDFITAATGGVFFYSSPNVGIGNCAYALLPLDNLWSTFSGGKSCEPGFDFLSQHKLLVTYNGQPITWRINTDDPAPVVACNVLEKDKFNPIPDKFGNPTSQFPEENLVTKLVDVSDFFVCKPRWKQLAPGLYESAGVLDVYFIPPKDDEGNPITPPTFIADNILAIEVSLNLGGVPVFGTDIQDICVLGFSMGNNAFPDLSRGITKPQGDFHYTWDNPLGSFVSCEEAALWQRAFLGVPIQGFEQALPSAD